LYTAYFEAESRKFFFSNVVYVEFTARFFGTMLQINLLTTPWLTRRRGIYRPIQYLHKSFPPESFWFLVDCFHGSCTELSGHWRLLGRPER